MTRGAKPTSRESKELAGNPGHRNLDKDERPVLAARRLSKPAYVTGYAATVWKQVCGDLVKAGVLRPVDTQMLAAFCVAVARFVTATKKIAREGDVVILVSYVKCGYDDAGIDQYEKVERLSRSPWSIVMSDAAKLIRSLGSELGLSPAGRERLHVLPELPEDGDPIKALEGRAKAHESTPQPPAPPEVTN